MNHLAEPAPLGDCRERTVYLDWANWADLADGKIDSHPLEQATASGSLVPVLSFV